MDKPKTALDAYKSFIDELVSCAKERGGGPRLAELGNLILESKADEKAFKKLFSQLSSSQRDLLVRVLQNERQGAIHDVLAALTWQIDCNGFALTFHGEPMQYIEGGLHYDFIGRASGKWDWPSK